MVGLEHSQETGHRSQMKIVQVSPYSMDRPGGVQAHIRDLAIWLRHEGHEVRIVSPPGTGNLEGGMALGSFRTMKLHGTAFEISRAGRRDVRSCLDDLRNWGAEVMHLHTPWTPMLAWQVWRGLRIPSVATFHATLPEGSGFDPFRWYIHRAARYFNHRLDAVLVPSRAPQSQWQALGLDPVPQISPPAIDLSRWSAARVPKQGGPHVVFMGRLEERKGARVLLEAWARIAAALPEARLTIAGDGGLKQELTQFAQEQALPRVQFLPPPSDDEAPKLVASGDFFAAPAIGGESFGLVLIEAMSAGALPIAAANPGYETVLSGGGEALLVPPSNPTALAKKVIELTNDVVRQTELLAWTDTRAKSFDVSTVGPSLVKVFQHAISRAD